MKLQVRFTQSFEDVVFGFHLKSVSGIEIAGLSYPPPNEKAVVVREGDFVYVYWKVRLLLWPGTYFGTFGVRSISEGGFIYRVVDGLALKIVGLENSPAFGLCDISCDGVWGGDVIKGNT
jgi:lipopolysaccharide transport system ATP-binding protein